MSDVARSKRQPSRVGAFFVVAMIFVGLGPLIGSLTVWTAAIFAKIVASDAPAAGPVGYLSALGLVLFFGYVIGIGYALVAGAFIAAVGIWCRWNNILTPSLAAVIAAVAGAYIEPLYFKPGFGPAEFHGIFAICLIAALPCWYLTRGIVRSTW